MKAIILGAGRGLRRLDPDRSEPDALALAEDGRAALGWISEAFDRVGVDERIFVGGYHIEKVIEQFPGYRFYYNPDWSRDGSLNTLRIARQELTGPCIICTLAQAFDEDFLADLIDSPEPVGLAVRELTYEETVIASPIGLEAVEFAANRIKSIETEVGEFSLASAGALKLERAEAVVPALFESSSPDKSHALGGIVTALVAGGINVAPVTVGGRWAPVVNHHVYSQFVLGTKAESLRNLRDKVRSANILDQVYFSLGDWRCSSEGLLDKITSTLGSIPIIIRSSTGREDSWSASFAGHFDSIGDVDGSDRDAIRGAIDRVVESFEKLGQASELDQILVQPYLQDVTMSGVILTRDVETGAPYYTLNFDDTSGKTDTVTSGHGQTSTRFILRSAIQNEQDPRIVQVCRMASEIEQIVRYDSLDLEFAIDRSGTLYLLQARFLILPHREARASDEDFEEAVAAMDRFFVSLQSPPVGIAGSRTVFGNMPDWNPAEILGKAPRPLALSLYRHLITDRIWSKARAKLGYRDVGPTALIRAFSGRPYVDVRASLNTFLPKGMEDEEAECIVCAMVDRLVDQPDLHDKLEFAVAITCVTPDFGRRAAVFEEAGIRPDILDRMREGLREITDNMVKGTNEDLGTNLAKLQVLGESRERLLAAPIKSELDLVHKIHRLLDDCMTYGTLPFSILARHAFVATAFLKSFQEADVISEDEVELIQRGIPTVAQEFSSDVAKLARGEIERDDFLERYGHLRPGTYDLQSSRYDNAPDLYLPVDISVAAASDEVAGVAASPGSLLMRHATKIDQLLLENGLSFDSEVLADYIVRSVPAREYAKFEFSKNLSAALELIANLGERLGISADGMSFLPISRILDLRVHGIEATTVRDLERIIESNRKKYVLSASLRLPDLIRTTEDFRSIFPPTARPNFITAQSVAADVVVVGTADQQSDLKGKIIAIESADPGYDWIFARSIAGLVTQYGGVASHMAIRCAEFGLPAAIGCGEKIYEEVSNARRIHLDAAAQTIQILS